MGTCTAKPSTGKHKQEAESPINTSPPLFPRKRTSRIQNDGATAVSPMNADAQQEQMQLEPKTSPIPDTRFGYTSIQFPMAKYMYPPPLPSSQNYFDYSKIDFTKTAKVASPEAGMVQRRPTCPGKLESGISEQRRGHPWEHQSPSLTFPTAKVASSLNYQNVQVGTVDVVTAIPPQEDYHHVMVGSGSIAAIQAVPNTPPCPVDSEGYPVDIPPGTLTPEHGHHQQRFTPPSMSTLAPTPGRQPDYQNITPGPDVVNSLANSSLQTSRNYMNITLGPYVALSYTKEREHPKMDSSQDCSLRTHSVRTAVVDENVNYTQLDFEKISVLQVLIEERKQEKDVKKKQPLDGDVDKVQH